RYRNFRSRNQVVVAVAQLEQIVFEFGKLACPEKALRVGHEWRNDFLISVLFCMDIEHEVDQSPFQPGALAGEGRESGTGYFGRPFEIHDSQGGTQVPVGLWGEFEARGFADPADLDVLVFGEANRNLGSCDVGDSCDKLEKLVFDGTQGLFLILD